MEENSNIFSILYFIPRKVKYNWNTNKDLCSIMEKVLWTIKHVKSGLWSFLLEISHWTMLHSWIDQLKLIETILRKSMSYHVGDSRHTQNIQIHKVIRENKNMSFILQKKTIQAFWPNQYFSSLFHFQAVTFPCVDGEK